MVGWSEMPGWCTLGSLCLLNRWLPGISTNNYKWAVSSWNRDERGMMLAFEQKLVVFGEGEHILETWLTSSQDRIPEEERDTDSQGILSIITAIWKSWCSEDCQAADHLKDLRIFSPLEFDSMELFKRAFFPPQLLFYHFCILPIYAIL